MQTLDPRSWKWDWADLPSDVQRAFINPGCLSHIRRLTPTVYAFREIAGSGAWLIGSLEELTPHLSGLPIPTPYSPPVRPPAESDVLDLSGLNITIDF
jgi:hypothetical protein